MNFIPNLRLNTIQTALPFIQSWTYESHSGKGHLYKPCSSFWGIVDDPLSMREWIYFTPEKKIGGVTIYINWTKFRSWQVIGNQVRYSIYLNVLQALLYLLAWLQIWVGAGYEGVLSSIVQTTFGRAPTAHTCQRRVWELYIESLTETRNSPFHRCSILSSSSPLL